MLLDPETTNIILYCSQWEAAVRFYRDGLGLPALFSTDWFVEFRLTETSRLSIADERRASIKSSGGRGVTLSLQVKDIDAARESAERMGMKPTSVKKHPWGARIFHLYDPEGHRIEVWQSRTSPGGRAGIPGSS